VDTTLTNEEKKIAEQVDKYFLSSRMTFADKLFHALLIAQHDLEAHHYCSEEEHQRLLHYISILQGILHKVHKLEKTKLNEITGISSSATGTPLNSQLP